MILINNEFMGDVSNFIKFIKFYLNKLISIFIKFIVPAN